MTITTHINEITSVNGSNVKMTYKLYRPTVPSDNYVFCLHGMGERAVKYVNGVLVNVTDGSLIARVEKHGYPKHAKNGFEFPFNIIAPQCGVSYSTMKKVILPWIVTKFSPSKIIGTGLSLGGITVYELLANPNAQLLTAFAPVCGKGNAARASLCVDLPGQAWHGDKDTTVKYAYDVSFIKNYNASHTNQIELITLAGVGHNAWDKAYSVTTGLDTLLQWIIAKFNA